MKAGVGPDTLEDYESNHLKTVGDDGCWRPRGGGVSNTSDPLREHKQ
jgi:hypothetical protein